MADAENQNTEVKAKKIDVPLQWKDFLYSLEEVRHRKGAISEERDWFKLNPLEILFLGCNSVIKNDSVSQQLGTIVIGLENITPMLHNSPRIFGWVIDTLFAILKQEKCSTYMWQKCWKTIIGIEQKTKHNLRLRIPIHHALWKEILSCKSGSQNQPLDIRQQVDEISNALDRMQTSGKDELIELGFQERQDSFTPIQVKLISEKHRFQDFQTFWEELRAADFVNSLLDKVADQEQLIFESINLVRLLFEIKKATNYCEKDFHDDDSTTFSMEEENMTEIISVIFDDCKMVIDQLLNRHTELSELPTKIIMTVYSFLCHENLQEVSMQKVWNKISFTERMEALMGFSFTETYLDSAADIFASILEFMMSAIDTSIPPSKASLIHLPNILTPVLGCKDGKLICNALEYGSLALRSKHMKSLLGEGLWYMQKSQSLFKSTTYIREHITKCAHRIDAVSTALDVIEKLLSSATTHEESTLPNNDRKADSISRKEEVEFDQSIREERHKFLELNQNPPENENETDEDETEKIVLLMYELACCTVKNGENTSYTFASIIPGLFNPSYLPDIPESLPAGYFREFQTRKSHISWKINKTELAYKTLSLCVKCMKFGSSSTFQICSVMIPKLARNLDRTELTDAEKLNALLEFLNTCDSKAETKEAVNGLVTHGLDLISMLMPKGLDVVELKLFLPMMLRCLEKILNSTSLLFIRNSCDFFVANFPKESEKIKDLFLKLLQKGKKNDIRNIHLFSAPWIQECRFRFILRSLFDFADGVLKSKQMQCICEIIPCIVDIENRLISDITEQSPTQDDSNTICLVQKLTEPIITTLSDSLSSKTFNQETQRSILERVSNLTLYKALFKEEFIKDITESSDFVMDVDARIPADVRDNANVMSLLQLTARRLEHMQVPRYQALKAVLVDILKVYLRDEDGIEELDQGNVVNDEEKVSEGNAVESDSTEDEPKPKLNQSKATRQQRVESYLKKMPQNQRLHDRLLTSGYSNSLWEDDIHITVQTNGSLNIEENLRQTLLASFNEYVDLLKQLGIPVIKIEGKDVKIHEVFSDELTITDLKGRRAVVIKIIDKQLSRNQQPRIHARKLQLLADEERIETEMEAKASTKLRPKSFKAKVNVSFLDCAACCGPQIIGCYAPNGDHCERPLEIGMRCDSAFASIYDENNTEIENAEMLFMDEGVYIYRAYSNGHPYDTSQVWTDFFHDLLENRQVVPSIILAHHMPNRHTWAAIRRIVPAVLTGTILSCDFDFTTEWRTYYDSRPESVRCGKDIILIKGFKTSKARPELQRQFSAQTSKDLGGMIFDDVMQGIMQDEVLNQLRFLGGSIAEYISDLIETGVANEAIIADHFSYDRWRAKYINIHKSEPMTKVKIIQSIRELVHRIVDTFVWKLDLEDMFDNRRRQFIQLKKFAEKRNGGLIKASREMAQILKKNIKVLPIDTLPMNVQEEVMHWIFGNEDRVWRYRGGRDGYETIDQYLRFLPHLRSGDPNVERLLAFPGVIAVTERHGRLAKELIQARDIAAYGVGEYVKDFDRQGHEKSNQGEKKTSAECYEIVTAWVNQDYRKLGLSTRIYLEIFKSVKSSYVAFDVIHGSAAKVIDSSPVFKILKATLPMTMIVQTQEKSYQVETSSAEEQFERLIVRRRPVSTAVHLYEACTYFSKKSRNNYFVFLPILFCMVAIILYICFL